eukprot:gb/GEZJ01008555.1/.p1 GENE.gb/GEZJ01008555.1/~~gb/GEZJ01008555.1/.p1  ORF type:complete len:146 (+),score=3.92 gb/GEZJ01008555.1/:60-497(+)
MKESLFELSTALKDLAIYHIGNVRSHILIETGAPKSICSQNWVENAEWKPIKQLQLPDHIRSFRFAGTHVHALQAVCPSAEVANIVRKQFALRQTVFLLPPLPVTFLVGLQAQRSHLLDVSLRPGISSHLKINSWNSIHQVTVRS